MTFSKQTLTENIKFLELLRENFPDIPSATSEIVNLEAILNLPKGTEHFLSDIHGEHLAFLHLLKTGSGVIKTKIDDIFGNTLTKDDRRKIATLICYPEEKLAYHKSLGEANFEWYRVTIYRLVDICRVASSKYTRSKVRKALPPQFSYIIDELLHANGFDHNKDNYNEHIVSSIINSGSADEFITAISNLIGRLIIDHLHIIGDIFDRGPGADIILDHLLSYHKVDFQWGNHDLLWMGAAAGHGACIANVIANCLKYNNFDTLEDGYGINVRPLATFAMEQYRHDSCDVFMPKHIDDVAINEKSERQTAKIHKAIAVILFKLEGQIIKSHPEFNMDKRLMFDKIDYDNGTITLDGITYTMKDSNFPTIDKDDPYQLTPAEQEVISKLSLSFTHSEKLAKHIKFLYKYGSMYLVCNGNLLFHGCIPMEEDGSFSSLNLEGKPLCGKALLDAADRLVRVGYFSADGTTEKAFGLDFIWYLWCGPKSPLNGKNRITTFERYFIEDPDTHTEHKDPYYRLSHTVEGADKILHEFSLYEERSKIINGHMPVKISKGESPIKAEGKLIVIDGGLSKAYHPVTGIAGYTLIFNSRELVLSEHNPFDTVSNAVSNDLDMHNKSTTIEKMQSRIMIKDTDNGLTLESRVSDLQMLVASYRSGVISQKDKKI